jgi:hypothetical protein
VFIGVRSHEDALSVCSYDTARAALERAMKTPTGRARKEQRFGFHLGMNRNHGVTWARELDGGEIAFRLYDTDVVVWYPDNSVEIDNFGTVTTSAFARQFLPGGMSLAHPVERRGIGRVGHRGIYYSVGERRMKSEWGDWTLSVNNVCFGGLVRFRETGGGWRPDLDTIDEIVFPELDQKRAREVSRQYAFKDFEKWLSIAPQHMRIEHDCWSIDDCLDALAKRDFTLASMFLPLITIPNGWGAANRVKALPFIVKGDKVITLGSLKKLRLALYEREGVFDRVVMKEIPSAEFDRRMARVRQMHELDVVGHCDYGPYA